ncbi:hypothetical protein B0919_06760 [Hymenobacter sp. CRA2]|nr:hypothetical protein B0919_06760 [Hymenobacter sp. CRA2]
MDGVRHLPDSIGHGFIRLLAPDPGLMLGIHRYTLAQQFTVQRQPDYAQPETLLVSFQAFGPAPGGALHLSTAQIASTNIGFATVLPAHTEIFMVALAIEKPLLNSWLQGTDSALTPLLTAAHPLVLDTLITPAIQQVLLQVTEPRPAHPLDAFFYRIKAQELLYCLLRELAGRAAAPARHLHPADVEKIFRVRTELLASLSEPPSLPALALAAGLSETRMRQLFRQVFGMSPYDYFQAARMEEARRRLPSQSVAEVGYQLGFTNLSHFARLFAKHFQLTPKKYQATQGR